MTARRGNIGLAAIVLLAGLWLLAASRVHVNASWSDGAWGYLALPILGDPEIGDAVLFEPRPDRGEPAPAAEPGGQAPSPGAAVPYLKTVRGVAGMRIAVDADRAVSVGGVVLGIAKPHALDGRALEAIAPGTVPAGYYYLHGDHVDSHDSRYAEIGLVPRGRILARALALPDLPWLGLEGPLVGPEDFPAPAGRRP